MLNSREPGTWCLVESRLTRLRSSERHSFTTMFLLSWLVLLLLAEACSSAKIIGGSAAGGSHYMMIRNVMEELASRGHEVVV